MSVVMLHIQSPVSLELVEKQQIMPSKEVDSQRQQKCIELRQVPFEVCDTIYCRKQVTILFVLFLTFFILIFSNYFIGIGIRFWLCYSWKSVECNYGRTLRVALSKGFELRDWRNFFQISPLGLFATALFFQSQLLL